MILLITACERGEECAAALQSACGEDVDRVVTARAALASLRSHVYRAVVIDESQTDMESVLLEAMQRNLGTPVPIYVNFALRSMERVLREVQTGLRRSDSERLMVMRSAISSLQIELKDAVAGILLSSELALGVPGLPSEAEAKLRSVWELAQGIRQQLESQGALSEL